MYIRRLVIRNFRALSHFDVTLQPGLTCLIGENNSGKTTILQALRLVLDANFSATNRQLAREDFTQGIDIGTPQQIVVAVEFADFKSRVESEALVSDWTIGDDVAAICYRFRPSRKVREALQDGSRIDGSLKIEDYNWQLVGTGGRDPAKIKWDDELGVNVRFDRLTAFQLTFLQALRDVEDDLRRTRFSPLAKLLEAANLTEQQKEALLGQVRSANNEIRKDQVVIALAKSIRDSLKSTVGDVYSFNVDVGVADATFSALTRSLTLLVSARGLADADPSRNGLGLNNALYISMLLEVFRQRSTRSNVAGQLLLVEEPEAHLHPELQRIVFAGLQESATQTIATTHSTHIASQAKLTSLVVLTGNESPVSTSVVPKTGCNLSSEEELDLERYLDATKSTLLFSKRVILVEGMSEVFLIPSLVKKVMGIDLQREGIAIVPIHGTHFLTYAKLFQTGGIEKRCAIITDGDLVPSDSTEQGPEEADDAAPVESVTESTTETLSVGNPTLASLKALEGPFLSVHACDTTFELVLASHGNLAMFAAAAKRAGLKRIAASLQRVAALATPGTDELEKAAKRVLNSARRVGKARFAQLASLQVSSATEVPQYIKDAISWVRQ